MEKIENEVSKALKWKVSKQEEFAIWLETNDKYEFLRILRLLGIYREYSNVTVSVKVGYLEIFFTYSP